MTRKQFVLNLPFREINSSDAGQPFANILQPINHIDLSYLVERNYDERYVFVYELDGKVLAFITFLDRGDHFHLDLVEANQLYEEYKKIRPGFLLITLLENLSIGLGFSKITLHSIQDRIQYYLNLGYEITGEPMPDQNYGPLTPMTKSL